jgi:hypothetical protein
MGKVENKKLAGFCQILLRPGADGDAYPADIIVNTFSYFFKVTSRHMAGEGVI